MWAGLIMALLVTGCEQERGIEPADLTILHTGRLRGNVYPYEFSEAPLQYYPIIAAYVAQVREEAAAQGGEVLLIDVGDSLTGSFASLATRGEIVARFFNEVGYDAVLLGNLDASLEPGTLEFLEMPVLAPFAHEDDSPVFPGVTASAMIQKGPYQIELLANFYGDQDPSEFPERFPNTFGPDPRPVRPIRDYAEVVAEFPAVPNRLRVFSWFKFEAPEAPPLGYLRYLHGLGIDVILAQRIYNGGRQEVFETGDFQQWVPPVSLNILRDNRGFTVARIDLKKRGSGWEVLRYQLVPMVANVAPADAEIIEMINEYSDAVAEADEVLGELEEDMDREAIRDRYLRALAGIEGADGALYSVHSIRSEWNRGMLRGSNVYESLPWTNPLAMVTLRPDELRQLRDEEAYSILMLEDGEGDVRLTTSQYFSGVLGEIFDLRGRIEILDMEEYEFLIRYLREWLAEADAEGVINEHAD